MADCLAAAEIFDEFWMAFSTARIVSQQQYQLSTVMRRLALVESAKRVLCKPVRLKLVDFRGRRATSLRFLNDFSKTLSRDRGSPSTTIRIQPVILAESPT